MPPTKAPQAPSTATGPLCRIFGVRHLSPAAAFHLGAVLDEMKPTAVLVEGPSDATEQIKHLVHKDTRPPLALLCYTKQRPVKSIVYPLAAYSPEWIALTWGVKNGADVRFIDLPATVFLQMHEAETPEATAPPTPPPEGGPAKKQASEHTLAYLDDPYEEIARLSGEPDHETWWERHFEHTTEAAAYSGQIFEFGKGLRELRANKDDNENLVREAYMRQRIRAVLKAGHHPEKTIVVCGAYHSPALTHDLPPMDDKEYKALPKADVSLTLMPYSYYRLSSQSGYGAGNHAPAYYQHLFDAMQASDPGGLNPHYQAKVCHALRKKGIVRSSAEVIEAVRLAESLAALNDCSAPCLRDLRDAAAICLGRGDMDVIDPVLTDVEVGRAVGRLPKGVSRTSIQDDFYYQLDVLYLEKYQTEEKKVLELDLREDRAAKSKEAGFRDLARSTFLHRLKVIGVSFGEVEKSKQDQATWKEIWTLRWKPSSEIELVENALLGDTIEMAAAVRLAQRLAESERIDQAARIVKDAATCQLADALEVARRRLQALAVEANGFVELSGAIGELAEVIHFGTVRKLDPEPLKPLVSQLFLRATLAVRNACLCDDEAAREQVAPAILRLHDVSREQTDLLDVERWNHELDFISANDALNAYVSGFVTSLLLPRLGEEALSREVGRRLLPGIPPDVAANWFEGLVQHNRQALFMRQALWRQLDAYVQALDEPGFKAALVPLRRAFGDFEASQLRRVVSCLVEATGEDASRLVSIPDAKLSDEEAKALHEQLGDLGL